LACPAWRTWKHPWSRRWGGRQPFDPHLEPARARKPRQIRLQGSLSRRVSLGCGSPERAEAWRTRQRFGVRQPSAAFGRAFGRALPKRQPPSRRSGALARRGGGRPGALQDAGARSMPTCAAGTPATSASIRQVRAARFRCHAPVAPPSAPRGTPSVWRRPRHQTPAPRQPLRASPSSSGAPTRSV